ncbi:FAD linked oxidase [Anopheles sinensis]|uniref:FAD linked oxidase n=1 Tax=Anopheles sinensis TaxID=74873 RepID=A0A084W6B8_ANOSI|nr:FAD linked oxidase [Anopheles sinensis]
MRELKRIMMAYEAALPPATRTLDLSRPLLASEGQPGMIRKNWRNEMHLVSMKGDPGRATGRHNPLSVV